METVPHYPVPTNPTDTLIVNADYATVIAEYDEPREKNGAHQSEAQLEKRLIEVLISQGYEYLPIHTQEDLLTNLRTQIELLNTRDNEPLALSDDEWKRLLTDHIAKPSEGRAEKTHRVQKESRIAFERDNGTTRNITLLDRRNPNNNRLQVINQYSVQGSDGTHPLMNRYDVTILVNGLPMVHIELKKRGVSIKEAFQQIDRYQKESFWAGLGLYEYVQLFVISNGSQTKYYSNTVRNAQVAKYGNAQERNIKAGTESFEFTSYWADAQNHRITDLIPFARTFLAKRTILNIITRYCVLNTEGTLLVMRPYQIVATERIINRVLIANNDRRRIGTRQGGGFIWHTTGSGKTLTSFKTAQLLAETDLVEKVLFVVDRKDLDYQTMKEYDAFEKGAANSNSSTRILNAQLSDPSKRIIITTIHKLNSLIKSETNHPAYSQRVAIIFDECHRSQFGDMHRAITKRFTKYSIFGFTGTPIFDANSTGALGATTESLFGERLHEYTVVNAIGDGNVLPFRIEYNNVSAQYRDVEGKTRDEDEQTRELLNSDDRIRTIADYILTNYAKKTNQGSGYNYKGTQRRGFNSILATSSIEAARKYYTQFAHLQAERIASHEIREDSALKIAIIYSKPGAAQQGFMSEENFDTDDLNDEDWQLLSDAVGDYNAMFGTSFSLEGNSFENYYKDVSQRMKNRELDLLIVVNMFLTGFDSKTVNTLWVDKNLRMHGLMQAYSRTNRILNAVKPYGNIVCFRDLEENTNEALGLFGDKNAASTALIEPYSQIYAEYTQKATELLESFPIGATGLALSSEGQKAEFVQTLGEVLDLHNKLMMFDEYDEQAQLIDDYTLQDYTGTYQDVRAEVAEAHIILEDPDEFAASTDEEVSEAQKTVEAFEQLVFEIDLVKHQEVNVDYILELVARLHGAEDREERDTIRRSINRAVHANPELRPSEDIIQGYVEEVVKNPDVYTDTAEGLIRYASGIRENEEQELIKTEKLNPEKTKLFMDRAFETGEFKTTGTDFPKILPKIRRFGATKSAYARTKKRVEKATRGLYERFRPFLGR